MRDTKDVKAFYAAQYALDFQVLNLEDDSKIPCEISVVLSVWAFCRGYKKIYTHLQERARSVQLLELSVHC